MATLSTHFHTANKNQLKPRSHSPLHLAFYPPNATVPVTSHSQHRAVSFIHVNYPAPIGNQVYDPWSAFNHHIDSKAWIDHNLTSFQWLAGYMACFYLFYVINTLQWITTHILLHLFNYFVGYIHRSWIASNFCKICGNS